MLYLTTLNAENAEGLEAIIRSKSPWCGYRLSLPLLPQPSTVESLFIAEGTGNRVNFSVLSLSALTRLKTIRIGDRCFLFVKQFRLHNLPLLSTVEIGLYCFVVDYGPDPDASLSFTDCPLLRTIDIGFGSFMAYSSFEVMSAFIAFL